MTRTAGPRLEGYALLTAAGLVAALALRRPELAVVSAPFALALALGLRLARDPGLEIELHLESERVVELEPVAAVLRISARERIDRLALLLDLPDEIEVEGGEQAIAVRVPAGTTIERELTLRATRWGVYEPGRVEARARDAFRVVAWQARYERRRQLKVYPRAETLSRILPPLETQARAGNQVARARGDGIEYADLRDYVAGDRLRAINWRASARRGDLVVNERHPERSSDIVLLVDSFADLQAGGRGVLDDAVRATATLALRYLERRDRVGLVGFGGVLRWIEPGSGIVQRYRLVEALIETGVAPTYTWRNVNVIPARILPAKSLVLALTPLVDERFVAALEDLRARRYDVAVVEIDPLRFVEPGRTREERIAYRLWLLRRDALRTRLHGLGIAVSVWDDRRPLDLALEEVRTFRRHAQLSRG